MDILSTPDLESPPERWAPVGAVAESPDTPPTEPLSSNSTGTVDALLEENEKMASSLLSLTSHFAQVQFRLKQIVEGPEETKAERLKELEAFAEKGIPDIKSCVVPRLPDSCESAEDQNGLAEELPTSEKLAKQDVIIQEIKKKLQISHLDNIASLSNLTVTYSASNLTITYSTSNLTVTYSTSNLTVTYSTSNLTATY
ncbi:RUNDC1 [Bugula neritina]|uniref:RUNDC1 n=1 Tax=Bugula neritina TaxID=10212 RepID=A0A7J7K3F5_BUGNE|nr:RUNDC1 [Bugula neritina]